MNSTAIIAILSVFGLAPMTVFGFILLLKRQKHRVDELRYKKEILELELEREAYKIKLLEEENRKYDRLIQDQSRN